MIVNIAGRLSKVSLCVCVCVCVCVHVRAYAVTIVSEQYFNDAQVVGPVPMWRITIQVKEDRP
jgi:hypothetical protein